MLLLCCNRCFTDKITNQNYPTLYFNAVYHIIEEYEKLKIIGIMALICMKQDFVFVIERTVLMHRQYKVLNFLAI